MNVLSTASQKSGYPKEIAAAQIIPVTYCKITEAISTRALGVRYMLPCDSQTPFYA